MQLETYWHVLLKLVARHCEITERSPVRPVTSNISSRCMTKRVGFARFVMMVLSAASFKMVVQLFIVLNVSDDSFILSVHPSLTKLQKTGIDAPLLKRLLGRYGFK